MRDFCAGADANALLLSLVEVANSKHHDLAQLSFETRQERGKVGLVMDSIMLLEGLLRDVAEHLKAPTESNTRAAALKLTSCVSVTVVVSVSARTSCSSGSWENPKA